MADEIVRFRFVGYSLRIPTAYLRGGATPRPELGISDAVRLFASAPHLMPLTPAQSEAFFRPGSQGVWVTMEGHPQILHGQALLDAMTRFNGHENRDGERDANGFLVYRAKIPAAAATWAEIYVWPGDPERIFHCSDSLPPVRFPHCAAERWIGGTLRLSMRFPKTLVPHYLALEASLESAMSCALDGSDLLGRAWPPRTLTP
ncbi:hypothetical protein [Sabulicella rubraurantiaca]|uniref:hypothetical protein n=1 Tax=Sabulicella rubraurantiaca TaxID=2811429 RepID=UPI001A97BF74|nr:hypothetical protein [Sabulicella rubraurantiaca]